MTMTRRAILVVGMTILAAAPAWAGGGWIEKPGALYAKLGVTTLSTHLFHANDGTTVRTADFRELTLRANAEYGLRDRLSAELDFPLLLRHAFVTAEPVTGLGDLGLGLKYGLRGGSLPVAVGVGVELPTGNRNAFGRNKRDPNSIINLPTGDGEFNVWTRLYASYSFYPLPAFVNVDGGYNIRTKGLTNQYQAGLEGGYRWFDRLWLFGRLRRFATAGTADPTLVYSAVGLGEGVEYNSYGVGLSLDLLPNVSATFDWATAFGAIRNIYSGANLGFGVAVRL